MKLNSFLKVGAVALLLSFSILVIGMAAAAEDVVLLQDSGLDSKFLPDLIKKFENTYGIKVKFMETSTKEIWTKIFSMIAAGEQLDVTQAGGMDAYLPQLAEKGLVQPLDEFPEAREHIDMLLPMAQYGYTYEGKLYALPEELRIEVLMYNKKMWNEVKETLGVAEYPRTWDELTDLCMKVKEAGIAEYPLIWEAGMGTEHLMVQYLALVHAMGGKVFDEEWNPLLEKGSIARRALQWWADSLNKWKISDPTSTELRYYPAAREFAKGKHLFHMTYNLSYSLIGFREKHPLTGHRVLSEII